MTQYYNNPAMNYQQPGMMGGTPYGGYMPGVNPMGNMNVGLGANMPNMYQQPLARPNFTQILTEEQMAELRQKGGNFDSKVSNDEITRSLCMHKEKNQIAPFFDGEGNLVCPICGEIWAPTQASEAELEEKVEELIGYIQNAKLQYLTANAEPLMTFLPIIPLMRRIPKFCTIAAADFAKYEGMFNYGGGYQQAQAPQMNVYSMMNQLTGGMPYNPVNMGYNPMMSNPGVYQQQVMQQPMYQQPTVGGQPYMGQQPVQQPQMNQNMGGMVQPQQAYNMPNTALAMATGGTNEFGTYNPNAVYNGYQQQPMYNQPMYQQPPVGGQPYMGQQPVQQPQQNQQQAAPTQGIPVATQNDLKDITVSKVFEA